MSEQDFDLQPAEPASEFDLRPALEQEQTEPVSLTAFKAARGPAPEQAAKALQLAKDHGVSPQFAADHAEAMQQITDQGGFEDALGVSPVLSAFAGQSAVHASAVKDDVTVLQSLEMGLADVGYAAMARKYMDATPEERVKLDEGLSSYEEAAQQFAGKKPGFLAEVTRAIPNVAAYGASTVAGASLGGKGGGTLGMGAALYQLNRGVLFRRIVEQFPTPEERNFAAGRDVPDAEFAQWQKEYDAQLATAKEYAKKGALTGAVIGAVLGDAFTRSLPLAHEALEKIGQEIATKALADTVAKAALQRGTELAGHTLSGALLMAEQATVDDATVQQATTGKIDTGKALAAGKDAFVDGFGVALALSSVTPVKEFFGDLGRIRDAKVELGRLDDQVARAKASKFVQRSPQEAEALLGKMAAAGDTPTVYIDQQGLQAPEVAQKLVEALADGGQSLAQAQATQGDIAVPMGTYLTKIAPELHEQLREHTKLSSDGYTVAQAAEAEKALPQEPDRAVFDEYRQKALAAGRGAQESVAIGKIVSAAMQRFADGEGLGRSAADVSAQFPIDIGAPAGPGMKLEQAAFHGSPHVFEKFSMEHVGTGEGAQVYGHGLYFAEKKGVAEYYRDTLAMPKVTVEGVDLDALPKGTNGENWAQQMLAGAAEAVGDQGVEKVRKWAANLGNSELLLADQHITDARDRLAKMLADPEKHFPGEIDYAKKQVADLEHDARGIAEAVRVLDNVEGKQLTIKIDRGALYKVDIPEKSELLDYDKPLSEQPAIEAKLDAAGLLPRYEVRPADEGGKGFNPPREWQVVQTGLAGGVPLSIGYYADEAMAKAAAWARPNKPVTSGQYLYTRIALALGSSQAASGALRDVGIPGLQYLDQGSRFGNKAAYGAELGTAAGRLKDAGLSWNDALEKMIEQFPKAPTAEIDSALADAYKFRTHNFVIWDDSKIRTLDVLKQQPVEGTPLTAGTSERGHIVVGFPGENGGRQFSIDLSNPDRSTLAHETFHALSIIMGDIAQKETAHPEFRKDYDTLTRFMGYESAGDRAGALDPAKEEKAARAWEQYLFEGKAPSPELRGTFSRFKTWLTRIYGALKGNLPDDVRKVFDRMLAREKTQGEIDYAGHATAIIESKPIAEIQPGRYELAARRAGAKAMDLAREGSRDSKLITPQRPQGEPVRYEVVEAKSLVPSHSPESFTPNEAYPEGVQERFYQGQGEEQLKVVEGGAKLNPALLLANTPSPLDGPPIVTGGSKRIVLGGNGRTMMIQRAFKDQAAREQYRQALTARAREFGISPDEVAKLKEPVLVRVVPGLTEASPKAELVGAVRRFNEGMTQALSPKARALAEARTLTPETVDALGGLMFEHGDSSLRDVLRDRPKEVLDVLRRDGVINAQNQTQWISGDALTSDAKARIEGMFVGRVIENEGRLNATAPEVLNKVEKAAPYLLRVAGINPALDETGTVRKAVDLLNNARAQGLKLEDALGQGELLKKHDEAVVAMAELLATATPRDIGTRFKKWATFAGVDPRQTGMFGTAPTLETSLGTLLGGPERFKGYERAAEEPAPPPKAQAAAAPEQAQAPAEQQPQQSDLQKYRTASDLSHAMADVATKVKAEMERGREYLKSRDTDKFRGDLGKAGQEYIGAFDAILEAIDENTPRAQAQPEALDALLARMQADGEPIGFDAEDLRNLLAKPIGWKALTPPEARNVVNAVKNLRAAARRVNEVVLAGQKAQLRDVVKGMQTYLDARGTPDSGLPAPSGASSGEIEGAAAWVDKAATEGLQARVILERLGPNGRAIYDEFVRSRNLKEDLARDVGKEVAKFYDALPKELKKTRFDGVNGPGSPVFNDNLWTRQDMWEFASWWGSESGSDRIKAGLRITDGQAHEFMAQITSAEADLIDSKHKLNDEKIWPLVRDHASEVTGTEPTKIEARPFTIRLADGSMREMRGGYEPALYRADLQSTAKAPSDAQSIADYWGALKDNFDPSTANYFTKERAQNVSRVPDLNWSRYSGHVGSVLQYLAYDDFVRNAGRVFRDPEFRDLVQRRLGPPAITELDKFLGVAARGRVESGSDGANELSRMVGNGLRSRLATAAFQLNPRVWLGQMSHLPAAMFRLGLSPSDMVYGLSQSLRPSTWGESFDGSKQLPYRWNGYGAHMRAQLANIGPGDGPLTGRRMDAAQWSVYHVIDGFLSKTIYEAAASKAERAGATPEEARLAGDRGVERMMPPLNLAEQSSLARDRGVIGALILVRNFPNQLYNAGAETMWEARNAVWAADPGWAKAKAVLGAGTVAAAQYLGMVWSAHLFGRFLMGHGRQDDETWGDWGEREALAAPFYPIPFGSEIAEPVAEALVTDKTLKQSLGRHGLAAAPAIAELERAIRDLGTVVGSANPDEDRVFAGLRLAANALRLPSDPLRGARYGFDLSQGNVQPRGPFDLAGGFLYGERPRQTKNPFTTAQDLVSGD